MKTIKTSLIAMFATVAMMITSTGHVQANEPAMSPSSVIGSTTLTAPAEVHTLSYVRVNGNNVEHRFDYTLDAEGRVVSKMMSCWDSANNCWKPQSLYRADYGTTTHRLTFSTYNVKTHSFSNNVTVTEYDASQNNLLLNVPVAH